MPKSAGCKGELSSFQHGKLIDKPDDLKFTPKGEDLVAQAEDLLPVEEMLLGLAQTT